MHLTIEGVYENGEFFLEEIPNVKKAKVLITFVQEINDDVKGKIKFPTKKLGKIKRIEREDLYSLNKFSDDFMQERNQPEAQIRENLFK